MKSIGALLLGVLVWGCVESNPQPSPVTAVDTAAASDVVAADTGGGPDGSLPSADAGADITCVPDCEGKECGDDDCGGICGDCWPCGSCFEGECYSNDCCEIFEGHFWPGLPAVKVHVLGIDPGGVPGYALDLDENPDTCAPVGDCQDGLDNALGAFLASLEAVPFGELLNEALVSGTLVILAEFGGSKIGDISLMNLWTGIPSADVEVCDWQDPVQVCDYLVSPEFFSFESCNPLLGFDNVNVTAGLLSAGGQGYSLSMTFRIGPYQMTVTATSARLEGELVLVDGQIGGIKDGVLGGALSVEAIRVGLESIPEWPVDAPLSRDMLLELIDTHLVPDIDAGDEWGFGDPDGIPESVSFGIRFEALGAQIVGTTL